MKTNYLENLKILREKIPVGIAHALKILETTQGNAEEAFILIKDEYISNLIEKTGASNELVQACLVKNNFDVETSLKEIENKIYSSTELIFKYYSKDKRNGILLILDLIEKKIEAVIKDKQKLRPYDCWFNFELLETLDPYQFCFSIIAEWLLYEECEGYDYAICYHTDVVTEQIEKTLGLPDIANYIRVCRERDLYFDRKYENKKNGFIIAHRHVKKDSLYQKAEKGYFDNEELFIETLFNFAKTHINFFP